MLWIRRLWKRITCRHEYRFQARLYGDVINLHSGKRELWVCPKCDAADYRDKSSDW